MERLSVRKFLVLTIAILTLRGASASAAGGPANRQMDGMDMPMAVGHVDFDSSCSPAVKRDLNDGLAALYSFWFAESHQFFEKAVAKDAGCAIAYWGEAMSDYEQIEGGSLPEGEQLADGRRAIARGRAIPRKTAREKAYLEAVAIIFDATGIPDHDQRVQRFSAAMGALSAAYPADRQAKVIYAMSLLKTGMPADPGLLRARKAIAILNEVLKAEPDNPGVAHFIIHAADNPEMASLGLDAARRYAQLAPAVPHALHMPGHIFARLGLWDEDIRSNLASKRAAEQPGLIHTEAQNRIHAMEFLQYAYLQTGQDAKAAAIAADAVAIQQSDFGPGFRRYWGLKVSGFPARQTLETGNWAAALVVQPPPNADMLALQMVSWTHAVGAGHLRDRLAAERAMAAYNATLSASALQAMKTGPSSQWAEAKAWTLFAEGRVDEAITLLKPIADVQDKLGKGEVDLPAREMMADMLRLSGRLDDALQCYRTSLQADPGRFETLLHAGETAEKLHQDGEAAKYYRQLLKNAPQASPPAQQALSHARVFLAH